MSEATKADREMYSLVAQMIKTQNKEIAELEKAEETTENFYREHPELLRSGNTTIYDDRHNRKRLDELKTRRVICQKVLDQIDICPTCLGSGGDTKLDPRRIEPCNDPLPNCLKCGGTGTKTGIERIVEQTKQTRALPGVQEFNQSLRRLRKQAADAE